MSTEIGQPAPPFQLECASYTGQRTRISLENYEGGWLVLLFYPRDFSFVCPTELAAFSGQMREFKDRNCSILAVSVDTIDSHESWLRTAPEHGGIGRLQFPLASDPHGELIRAYGVWNAQAKVANRGLFIIAPNQTIEYFVIHSMSVGRSPSEVMRVLDALQTGGMCPANWRSADGVLDVAAMLTPTRVIGHYQIEQELGRGSFASVYSAWDKRLERRVALKVLRDPGSESGEALLAEARMAASVNHPNICTIYSIEQIDGLPLIVMEYLDGQPLSLMIGNGFSSGAFRMIASRLCSGLAAAHELGIVHGDLKPANVLIRNAMDPVIVDFGLANSLRRQPSDADPDDPMDLIRQEETTEVFADLGSRPLDETSRFTPVSQITGTPAYMAPEQTSGLAGTAASDIYSLGLILVEMLSRRRSWNSMDLPQLLAALHDPHRGEELASRVDPQYRDVLRRMLSIEPAERPTACQAKEWLVGVS